MLTLCVCQYPPCVIPFYISPSRIINGRGKFCSRACARAAQRTRIDRTCIQCGGVFSIKPSALRYGTGEFCSKRCRADARQAHFPQKFWASVQQCCHDVLCLYCCWPWLKYQRRSGYGKANHAGKGVVASRTAWELWHERLMPPQLDAAHYCNNPVCCNPSHIYPATRQQNVADAIKAGTFIRGSRVGGSKLTETDIPRIFAMRATGMTESEIARFFPVQSSAIHHILARKTWRHIEVDDVFV